MGCGSSKTKEHDGLSGKYSGSRRRSGQHDTLKEQIPDPGLYSTHRAIKSLGKGGTGETWLYQDRVTGEEVAIKLMRRPLPKVIEPNIQREIRVSPRQYFWDFFQTPSI
jgi:serine/threonine-protein kinase SRK2